MPCLALFEKEIVKDQQYADVISMARNLLHLKHQELQNKIYDVHIKT